MSEQAPEQVTQEQEQAQAAAPPPPDPPAQDSEETFPIRLVKRYTGDVHWNVAKGIWELVTHGETGEPNSEYALLGTIQGVDVPLLTLNAGGVETIVKSQQNAQQSSGS